MQPTDQTEFAALLRDVMAFYRQDVSPFAFQIWWQACQRFDLEQVRKFMTAHVIDATRGQFAPKPADMVRQLVGTTTDRAMMAWGKVHHAMSSVGAYTDVVFDDAAIHAAIDDLGGWIKLCRSEIKELGYVQHRFCEAHRAYTERGQFDYPRLLSGDRSPDDIYARRGLPPPKPAIVGDMTRANAVFNQGAPSGKVKITYKPIQAFERSSALLPDVQKTAA